MQYEEYKQQVNNLEKEFEQKKIELIKDYVNSNNPYKIGDNVTDHMGTIQIEKITYGFSTISKIPCAIYRGIELKKDGSPKKQNRRDVWQTNLINWCQKYYCSAYFLVKTGEKLFIWKDIDDYIKNSKNCNKVTFMLESKFDEVLKHKPNTIYHVTNINNLNKIKKIGLVPKSKNKKSHHLDRIYLTTNSKRKLKKAIGLFILLIIGVKLIANSDR